MRAVAGLHCGASKDILLMDYRALVRSVIDYGCIAYESELLRHRIRLHHLREWLDDLDESA